ncbi:MAG: sulfite exporter TauE/SafE family protein [bacterium]
MFLTLLVISLLGGFMAGFLGVGGALVITPLMLTIPPLVGVGELSMKTVAGLSMVQVLFSSFSGIIVHNKNRFIFRPALIFIGIPMGLAAFVGSYFSKYFSNIALLYLFFAITIIFFLSFVLDKKVSDEKRSLEELKINKFFAMVTGSITGVISGMVGVGGGFILIPFMRYILKIPLKVTIGTSLGIIFIGALTGAIGKAASFQVEFALVLPIIIGSSVAANLGAKANEKTGANAIRYIFMGVIILSIIQVILKIIEAHQL